MKGFTFFLGGKDYFVVTSRKRKTVKFATAVMAALNMPENAMMKNFILIRMMKAECEIRTLANGRKYYEIHGDGFGGKGNFVDDGNTVVVKV